MEEIRPTAPTEYHHDTRHDEEAAPACCILSWWEEEGELREEDGEGRRHRTGLAGPRRESRAVPTAEALRGVLDELLAAPPPAAPAPLPSAATIIPSGEEEEEENDGQGGGMRARKPLVVLHGLPPDFVRVLLASPALGGIDPAFVAAHASRTRYRPCRRRRGVDGGGQAGAGFAHWVYPELVTAGRSEWGAVDDEGSGLAAVFCRASVWVAERADVLFLDKDVWGRPGPGPGPGLRKARRKGVTLVEREGREDCCEVCLAADEEMPSLEDEVLESLSGTLARADLIDVVEETVYDHWLDLFDILAPRRQDPAMFGGTSLEWSVAQALEANSDMATSLARRRSGRNEGNHHDDDQHELSRVDWTHLLRRLRLRLHLGATLPPTTTTMAATAGRRKKQKRKTLPDEAQQPPSSGSSGGDDENQRALDRVTYMGAILLPISIVTSVLSMNERFEPGAPLFWVLWAAACPLTLLTVVVIYADKLRKAEVWEEVSNWGGSTGGEEAVEVEEEEEEVGFDEKLKKKKKKTESHLAGTTKPPALEGRTSTRPEAVTYSGGDVVIDLSDALYPVGPGGNDGEGHGQGGSGGGEDDDGGEEEEDDEDEEDCDPNMVVCRPTNGTRPQAWRKKQLGWSGAAKCILTMQKPQRVVYGVPAGARPWGPGGRRPATTRKRTRRDGK